MNPDYRFCPRCATALLSREQGGRLRSHCESCQFTHWNNPLPVVAALVQYGDQMLLARNAAWPPKVFALITGFLEAGETAAQGICREVKEETNLDVTETNLIGVYEFHKKNELIIAYHVIAEGEIKLSEELLEYKLLAPEKLRPWPAGTGQAVADWMTSRGLPYEMQAFGKLLQEKKPAES
jgi:NAD+ diphosphatase